MNLRRLKPPEDMSHFDRAFPYWLRDLLRIIREDLYHERAQLAERPFNQPLDRSAITAVADQIIVHQAALEREVIEHIIEEKEILSLSQQRKFYNIIVEQVASGGLCVHDVRERD